jgi:hypothetical protein
MSSGGRRIDHDKHAYWQDLLRRFPASGLGVRDFCARHAVPEHRFYWWRRRLRPCRPGGPSSPPPPGRALFVPLRVADPPPAPAAAARPADGGPVPAAGGRIELALPGGVTVRLTGDVPPGRLAAVLGVLTAREGGPC